MRLTKIQRQLIQHLIEGKTIKEIAYESGRSVNTLAEHKNRARTNNNCRTTIQLIAQFVKERHEGSIQCEAGTQPCGRQPAQLGPLVPAR